jgi:hypothetical protein
MPQRRGQNRIQQLTGARGTLRWGYHAAGELLQWKVTKDTDDRWHLSAQVRQIDKFKAARKPLFFVVQLKGGRAWQWEVAEHKVESHVLHARLIAPEKDECEVASSVPRPQNSPCLITIGS